MSEYLLSTSGLTKQFGHHKAVNNVDLHVKKGAIYGFIGRNGAGKTTFLKMISGLSKPTDGEIQMFGYRNEELKNVRSRISCLIEAPGIYGNMSAYHNLAIKCRLFGINDSKYIENILKIVGLSEVGKKKTKHFSLGMKQRLGIANAILHDPELLILDEPTNGLDPIGIAEVREFIKRLSNEYGKTIIISSHILSEIALLADDIGIIDHGVLLEESSMQALEKRNRKYILLQVSDVPKTTLLLERQFHIFDYSVQDEQTIRIYDTTLHMGEINKALFMEDITVISSSICNDTLEDYFKKITGGEGIA